MPRLVAPDAGGAAAAAAAAASSGEARRRPVIEACIMRVMKARQTLEHHVLLETVREHLSRRFEPDPRMVKTVLDVLIDRDFLRRDDASPNVYHFVA
jgi:cullin 3